ncbi:MAG TPA: 7-carboxy-7-deazaguanine synthase QueE [Geminocystis sp. M7585_C2015_104]|nr:7-carboxy-7-deazaguanine synthase QueE [Geminocystis sp. M7585_C2015_104]
MGGVYLDFEYPVVEMFHSLQGEGFWTGTNAFFIRLAGCDVYCPWCDQKETWSTRGHPLLTVLEIIKEAKNTTANVVIVTGGEPLLYNLLPLTKSLKGEGYRIHLETSGSRDLTGVFDWITLSPKPYKKPLEAIYKYADELKVVVDKESDLIWAESEAKKVRKSCWKYLQPQWNNKASQELVINYILTHPHWRLSLQTHKFLKIQ